MLSSPLSTAKSLLMMQEGMKLKPYTDTAGKLTIGVGRNLDDRGITEAEALHLLANDIVYYWRELSETFPWFNRLDDVRQLALLSMVFNLGIGGLLRFTQMLSALSCKDYNRAAAEALNSHWATQVGKRATDTAAMFRTGELPDGLK